MRRSGSPRFHDDRKEARDREQDKIASHEEVLELLSEQARKGSVTAAAALERALRHRDDDDQVDKVGDAIDRILAKKT